MLIFLNLEPLVLPGVAKKGHIFEPKCLISITSLNYVRSSFCNLIYILDTFGEILWLRIPGNGQECEKIPGRCYARTFKKLSKYGQYIYRIVGNLVLITDLALK